MKKIMQTREGYPATGSPNAKVFTMNTTTIIKETRQKRRPISEAMERGTVENATMPSME